jgi:FkbM family methyltransferase
MLTRSFQSGPLKPVTGHAMPRSIDAFPAERAVMAALDMLGHTLLTITQTAIPAEHDATLHLTRMLEAAVMQCTRALHVPLVIEIGAHAAGFSRRVKRAMESTRVVAFEANPDVHAKHAALCDAAGIEYHNVCVSNAEGSLTLQVPLGKNGAIMTMGSILPHTILAATHTHQVSATTLDAFLATDVSKQKAIWLDVEGATGLVLDGAAEALQSCVLLYAELETVRSWHGQRIDSELVAQLGRHGLAPVLRDTYRARQYNALFLKHEVLTQAPILDILGRFPGQLATRPGS